MNKFFCVFVITLSFVLTAKGQEVVSDDGVEGSVGAGAGLEYGGLGVRLSGPISKHISLLGGVGYNFLDIAITGGVSYEPILKGKIRPEIIVMYGANAVITESEALHPRFARTYYGPSAGAGVHYYIGTNDNFFNIKATFPFTSTEYNDAIDEDTDAKTIPFYVSVGFHVAIGR
jgi:hypothetical protein